mgnify:CR=1 FL=1
MTRPLKMRKMFAGGMLPVENSRGPSGILASSQPLMDVVAQEAVNPMGGGSLSMAHGGFAHGGVHKWRGKSSSDLFGRVPGAQKGTRAGEMLPVGRRLLNELMAGGNLSSGDQAILDRVKQIQNAASKKYNSLPELMVGEGLRGRDRTAVIRAMEIMREAARGSVFEKQPTTAPFLDELWENPEISGQERAALQAETERMRAAARGPVAGQFEKQPTTAPFLDEPMVPTVSGRERAALQAQRERTREANKLQNLQAIAAGDLPIGDMAEAPGVLQSPAYRENPTVSGRERAALQVQRERMREAAKLQNLQAIAAGDLPIGDMAEAPGVLQSPAYVASKEFAPTVGERTRLGPGANIETIAERADMKPSEIAQKIFPYEASQTGGLFGPMKSRPGPFGTAIEGGKTTPIADLGNKALAVLDQAARSASQIGGAAGRYLGDLVEAMGTPGAKDLNTPEDYARHIGQIKSVNDALRRHPTVEGVANDVIKGEIANYAKIAIAENPDLHPTELSSQIADHLYNKYEAYYAIQGLQERELDSPEYRQDVIPEAADAAVTIPDDLTNIVEPSVKTDTDPLDNVPDANLYGDDAVALAKLWPDEGTTGTNIVEPPVNADSAAVTIPDDLTNIVEPSVNTDAAATIPGFLTDIVIEGSSTPSGNPATIPEKAGDTLSNIANNPEQTPKSREQLLLKFKKEFMDAMPQYKGASEEEKWLTVMNAGLQIAAGTSPNAITNIANGLKGLGAEFAKNEKEKRLWDQKVEVSAVKYGLESVALENAKTEALAKEGRVRKQFIVGKTFTDLSGVKREKGTLYTPTAAEMGTDNFQRNILPNLTTEGIYKKRLDNAGALTGIVRVGAKHGPKAGGVTEALNKYTNLTKDVRNNAKMLTMLDASIIQNAKGEVTGILPWASKKLNQLKNSVNFQKQIKILDGIDTRTGEGLERFQYQQQVIANMMLKEILGEGSKNVSNIDRTLASEIVGLVRGFSSIVADQDVIHQKLQGIRNVVQQGLTTNLTKMRNSEVGFRNIYTAFAPGRPGLSVSGEMATQRRRLLGDIQGVGQRTQSRAKAAGRGPVVLRASDYFDFDKMTIKKNLPR